MIRPNSSVLHLPDSYEPESSGNLIARFAQKKNRVIELVGGIKKTGYNEYYDYSFVEEAEVVRVLRSALNKVGLSLSVSTSEILPPNVIKTAMGDYYNYTIKMTFTMVDSETGYFETYPWLAMGSDAGDKAIYKAYTSGVKYFLLKNFLLPTDDDVERENIIPQGKQVVVEEPQRPAMDDNASRIMNDLADYYRQLTPDGARFDEERFYEAVWEQFHMWPNINSAAKRIKQAVDVRETVVWERN
jgi:hypothetical protein